MQCSRHKLHTLSYHLHLPYQINSIAHQSRYTSKIRNQVWGAVDPEFRKRMGHNRLVVALLHCCFMSLTMSFKSSRSGLSVLRSLNRQYVKPILTSSLRFSSSHSKDVASKPKKWQMSTKIEAETSEETTAEDLFGFDLPTNDNSPNLLKTRHTTAHIMAMAVQKLYPEAQVTIGPWIDQG